MKFKFAFDKILEHKKTLEDVARREWADAQREVDDATNELGAMYEQVDGARNQAARMEAAGGPRGPALAMIDEFIRGQKIRIGRQREKIRELKMEAERLHEILIEMAKERKTLEKLREKKYEEFRLHREQVEQKQIDELIVTRFKRAGAE